jgi:hypothetical protein
VSAYQRIRLWSVTEDCYVIRLSMWNTAGGEFFTMIRDDRGAKALRQTINGYEQDGDFIPGALDALMDAIDRGDDPGEITFTMKV